MCVGNVSVSIRRPTNPAKMMDVSSAKPPTISPSGVKTRPRARRRSKRSSSQINPEEVGQRRFITTKKTDRCRVRQRQIYLINQIVSPILSPLNPTKQNSSSTLQTKHRVKHRVKQSRLRHYLKIKRRKFTGIRLLRFFLRDQLLRRLRLQLLRQLLRRILRSPHRQHSRLSSWEVRGGGEENTI